MLIVRSDQDIAPSWKTLRELQNLKGQLKPSICCVPDEAHLLVPEGEDSPCKQVIRREYRTDDITEP
jgi:hypothetical protein